MDQEREVRGQGVLNPDWLEAARLRDEDLSYLSPIEPREHVSTHSTNSGTLCPSSEAGRSRKFIPRLSLRFINWDKVPRNISELISSRLRFLMSVKKERIRLGTNRELG